MDETPKPKQAACLVCRRSKVKCDWAPPSGRCKSKRVGLDKALFQVQEAVKRARIGQQQSAADDKVLTQIRALVGSLDGNEWPSRQTSNRQVSGEAEDSSGEYEEDVADRTSTSDFARRTEESLAVDDAENPLQLLARASYFQPCRDVQSRTWTQNMRRKGALPGGSPEAASLEGFFSGAKVNLDVGDDIDPIELGLITEEEADSLFAYFHANLSHTRWGFDPRLYTVAYTRSRSAFLCTSILAASALFIPTASALSKRLSNHVTTLAHRVMMRRHKSLEIVLAFMVNIPWMFPGQHSTDDEACVYISMATSIAIDLSLHKVIVPTEDLQDSKLALARGECLDTRTALAMDGYPDLDAGTDKAKLLLRNRERCWISLFVLERGMSLARGRPSVLPVTRLIEDCDSWHRSAVGDPQDGHLVSMAVLRRDLDGLFATVRSLCDGSQNPVSDGSLIAQSIQSSIERFFDQWYTEWGVSIGIGPQRRLPPYVDILVTHTRLSTYGGVINHPTAPVEVRQFFRTAGLSSALNVMRAAIQGEGQLHSMPNNTAIMISFAACFALTLSAYTSGDSTLAPSIRKLIDEAAGVLERIGTITQHRNGLSALYARYLRQIVRKAAKQTVANSSAPPPPNASTPTAPELQPLDASVAISNSNRFLSERLTWPEPLQFSAMSDDQIAHVLNQPGNEFEASFGGLSREDMSNFDWLYWPEFVG
ncbi:uncharacterized protein MAM_01347 [Metarhizium album ARSEF 1941]|uniref:Transcription factor, fungi n=1 Tax=Metarhizium album (strain ARSEF 1941) TaxID=1081103 RepID=A0A0B2X2P4_METAS|nr:uncharacterized protein MAM_01347 [Metarhizium album ARSEF 1941]KHO00569.1 Transcription factor, fungi [Metarhizium album ARSEF 1941]